MSETLALVVVAAVLAGILAFMFSGGRGRRGRPPRGVMTRLSDPGGARWAVAAMGGLALGSAYGQFIPGADAGAGAAIGILLGVVLLIPGISAITEVAVGVVAGVLAMVNLVVFLVAEDASLTIGLAYRIALVLVLTASFSVGVLLSGHMMAVGRIGLGVFGVVETLTFLADPAQRSSLGADGVGTTIYLLVSAVLAFGVGWAASEYVIGVIAIALAIVSFMRDAVVGDPTAAWVGGVAAITAAVPVALLSRLWGKSSAGRR